MGGLLLHLGGRAHQEVWKVEIVDVEELAHVEEYNLEWFVAIIFRFRTFQGVLQPQQLARLTHSAVPGEQFGFRPAGIGAPKTSFILPNQVLTTHVVAVDVARVSRRQRLAGLTRPYEPSDGVRVTVHG